MGEGRLWERLRIYSGKYLFNKSKFYLEKNFYDLTIIFLSISLMMSSQERILHFFTSFFSWQAPNFIPVPRCHTNNLYIQRHNTCNILLE